MPTVTTATRTPLLELYSEWKFCFGCGSSRDQSESEAESAHAKKLSICRQCKTAAYHNSECQRLHWTKGGHRRDCKKLAAAIQPLLDIIGYFDSEKESIPNRWWKLVDSKAVDNFNRLWRTNVFRWNQHGEYLEAMEGFQRALKQFENQWNDRLRSEKGKRNDCDESGISLSSLTLQEWTENDDGDLFFGIELARRLLFCAYCEADGNLIKSSRMRLAQCITILLECSQSSPTVAEEIENSKNDRSRTIGTLLNDAWMELMLSYEEEESPEFRRISYHVAHMAIQSSQRIKIDSCCRWTNPGQRPGFMGALDPSTETEEDNREMLRCAVVPRNAHPSWCRVLESHWNEIAEELSNLLEPNQVFMNSYNNSMKPNSWTMVGCGERGSGGDDHRVVSAGGKWTEYVLFGTGAVRKRSDGDAPITKKLLREYIPDAISLAESGGGEVIFSKLAPHTRIDAHCGPTNLRLTAHLGLVIPSVSSGDCRIRIDDEWHKWKTGKMLLFDDSYEHEIRNDTDQVRIVLLLRLWHPLLPIDRREKELWEARRQKEASIEKRYHPPL